MKAERIYVDVRDKISFLHGNIPGSINIPYEDIKNRKIPQSLPYDTTLMVYCNIGEISAYAVKELLDMGYQAVNLEGGFRKWLLQEEQIMSKEEKQRYARHISLSQIGIEGQKKLKDAKVLIIGAGGLGSPAALYLAAAGIGTIGIVDDDKVEISNLQRQIIHDNRSVGKNKALCAQSKMKELNDSIDVISYPHRMTPDNIIEMISRYDFIIDGTDNFETKFLINDACVIAKKPFCYGGILRFEGQLMTYVPGQGPCYRCIFEEIPKQGDIPNCSQAGVIGAVAGVIGSLQALEAVKYILNIGELLTGRMLIFDGLSMESRKISFLHSMPECRVCGKHPDITDIKKSAEQYRNEQMKCRL